MNIFCSTDDNYAQYCAVMLTSLFESNYDISHDINIYVMSEGLSINNQCLLQGVVDKYNGQFNYCQINKSQFDKCPIREGDHVTLATYFRFLIPDILPQNESLAIYLDVDMIVLKSFKPLLDLNISDYAIAAVDECGCHSNDVFERLEIDREKSYFNAGFLLINVSYWRQKKISSLLFDYVSKNAYKLKSHDQDALNVVLNKEWLSISPRWNWMCDFMLSKHKVNNRYYDYILSNFNDVAVVHFTITKPWFRFMKQPYTNKFFYYQSILGCKMIYKEMPPGLYLKRIARSLLLNLGLKKDIYKKEFYL